MRLTLKELGDIVNAYVDETKIGQTDFQASHNSISNLIDKIGKVFTIDNAFQDKLGIFDREDLPLGTTVEEWYQSLNLPQDYNENGDNTLAPSYPEYAPVCYSYSLGRKVIKTTIKQNTYERACNSAVEAATLVNMVTKRLFDSFALYKYGVKKEALGKIIDKIYANQGSNGFTATSSYAVGSHVSASEEGIRDAVCVKTYPGGNKASTLAGAIEQGYFVKCEMAITMKNPLEAAAGEARQAALKEFLIQVKKDVETASFATEGNSFNGNTIGSEEGLVLIVPKAIRPLMEVELEAGAFQLDKLAVPAKIIVVDELKDNDSGLRKAFGMLLDPRMVSVHNIYQAIREQNNAEGDFVNEYLHVELNVHVSNNTFCKVYAEDWN